MVTGPLRIVLWILGTLGVLWVVLWLYAFASMGIDGMMEGMSGPGARGTPSGGGAAGGGSPGPQSMMENLGADVMGAMFGGMLVQTLAMLGLVGVFVYLVVDSFRGRSST